MNKKQPGCSRVLVLMALMAAASPALAQVAPALGSLSTRGLAASTFTNGGGTAITGGGLCFTTGTGLATVTVTGGTTDTPCPTPASTNDQNTALATIMTQSCTNLPVGIPLEQVSIGGNPMGVFSPGCYTSVGALNISAAGIVTLTGNGIFVFRSTGGAINTGATSIVRVQGGACEGNVFFGANALTTLGAASTFVGTIVDPAGVTAGGGASISGRILAPSGTVTTDGNAITVPAACAVATQPSVIVTKVSNGGVGSFTFSGTNGIGNQTITTVTPGGGVSGFTQTLTAAGVPTTVTEGVPPAGFALTSISCTGMGAGGTATPNIPARTVTLNAAATALGSSISCTFTNTFAAAVGGAPAAPVPTLSEWAMILLASLLAFAGFGALRRRGSR